MREGISLVWLKFSWIYFIRLNVVIGHVVSLYGDNPMDMDSIYV